MMNDNSTDKEVNITDTILQFSQGLISKAEYINEMYRKHQYKLFQYSEHLKSSNISRIDILDGQVIMTPRDKGAKFICSEGDHRIAPIEILNIERQRCIFRCWRKYGMVFSQHSTLSS